MGTPKVTPIDNYRTEEVVVLFTDVHEFSIVMRAMGETGPLAFINEMYCRLVAIAERHGGTIIKYIGDALLFVFPVDDRRPTAARAVACAKEMRRSYAEQVIRAGISHETDLETGLAIGMVERGIVGHPTSRVDDVFGEAVNRAAMIGHHRGVAVTDAVKQLLPDGTPCTRLPDRTPKWQDDPLVVWAVE
jgi:class 3 adenylate cyclase